MIYNHNGSADLVGRGCNLYFHFPIFTNLVKSLIPWLADEKQIPDILLHQPEHTVDALLRGLTDGDGTLKNRGYSYASISERLSYQVMRILRCNSTPSYIKSRISANPITPNAKRAFICYASYSDYLVNQFDVDDRRGRFCGHKYRIIDDGNGNKYFAARIRSVRDVRRIGRAYEILTASDGYAASSCIIKNDQR